MLIICINELKNNINNSQQIVNNHLQCSLYPRVERKRMNMVTSIFS